MNFLSYFIPLIVSFLGLYVGFILILAAPEEKIHIVINQIILRIEHIKNKGIPIDTRLATQSGETKFLRPRPGAARMYPETDIPPIIITKKELQEYNKSDKKLSLVEFVEKQRNIIDVDVVEVKKKSERDVFK